jgi:DDE superfamily endonuclease
MDSIPAGALPLLLEFAPIFTQPTFRRFTRLLLGAILTTGRRTIANLLRTVGPLAPGDASSYQRVLSQAQWSGLRLAAVLCRFALRRLWPTGRVRLVGDDTVTEHKGTKVHGKARHRDPVRSTKSYTAWRWGHKWVVLAVLVSLPFARRPWALPLLVALYRSRDDNRRCVVCHALRRHAAVTAGAPDTLCARHPSRLPRPWANAAMAGMVPTMAR